MDLDFSQEQQDLMEAVRRFARERVTPELLAAWERTPLGIEPETWEEIARLGWLGVGLPAAAGGSGLGLVEVACLLSECGRGLIPAAVASAIRAAEALAWLEPAAPELAELASGRARAALAIDEEQAREPEAFRCRLTRDRIAGSKWYVQHAEGAALLLVAARDGERVALALVRGEETSCEALRPFAGGDAQGVVHFDEARVLRRLDVGRDGAALLRELRRRQTALALAEMAGGMDAVLEMTVAYVKEREQFGQKIAVFQAVQHQVADMAVACTAGRHLAWQAITRLAAGREEAIDLPAAAAWLGASFKQVAVTGHHLHGGAGFVVEHPLHWHSERAQSLAIRHAPERHALASVAAVLLDP